MSDAISKEEMPTNLELKDLIDTVAGQVKALEGVPATLASIQDTLVSTQSTLASTQVTVASIQDTLATLPTKDYLDDKLADLKGSSTNRLRRVDDKLNAVIDPLQKRGVLTETDLVTIHKFDPFSRSP